MVTEQRAQKGRRPTVADAIAALRETVSETQILVESTFDLRNKLTIPKIGDAGEAESSPNETLADVMMQLNYDIRRNINSAKIVLEDCKEILG